MLTRDLVEAPPEPSAADEARAKRSNGRIVIQAWLASRGLIAAVALLLAVVEGRSVSEMVSNWDVRHFENLATNGYLGEPDGTLMAFFPDFGSVWYIFSLAGNPVPNLNVVSAGLFALGCLLIAALIVVAPQRPRFGAVAFLVVVAFLLTNKVYSPQYVLWLLPFVVLARPRWRDWLVFTAGELIYFVAIWWHLAGVLSPGDSSADRIYWLAVIIRLGTQLWVAALVVRDILRPSHDPVRRGGLDDPSGGVLDGAPDAGWWPRLGRGSRPEADPGKPHPDDAADPALGQDDPVGVRLPGNHQPRRAL